MGRSRALSGSDPGPQLDRPAQLGRRLPGPGNSRDSRADRFAGPTSTEVSRPSPAETAEEDLVRRECLDLAHGPAAATLSVIPFTSASLVYMQWDRVQHAQLLGWLAVTTAATLAWGTLAVAYRTLRELGRPVQRVHIAHLLATFVLATTWALATVVALPADAPRDQLLAVMLFLVAGASCNVVAHAAVSSYFLAFQVPVCWVPFLALVSDGSRSSLVLAVNVAIFFALTTAFNLHLRREVVRGSRLRHRNAVLIDSLRRDQRHIAEMNSQLVRVHDDLVQQATHDPLTGLPNRALFLAHLGAALRDSFASGAGVAVMFIDLDRFKIINDTCGHAVGDGLLREVGTRVQSVLRADSVFARLGGDEFTVLLHSIPDATVAVAAAERIRAVVLPPVKVAGSVVSVTTSIGLAVGHGTTDSADDLLRYADAALYRAKEKGRNRVVLFDNDLRRALTERAQAESELRDGLDAGQVVAYYQPEVDLRSGRIIGAEALARWEHPTRGLLLPALFVPLAEEAGLIDQLGESILRDAARARRRLAGLGAPAELLLRVNVSPRQLNGPDVVARLIDIVRREGCDPTGLSLEVTETAVLTDVDNAVRRVRMLREAGLKVALDDFGTGYSSLALVRRLPLDGVKIDRAFVAGVDQDDADRSVVAAVVELGRHLDIEVTAEGVETEEQAEALRRLGCHRAQGFLFGAALRLDDLIDRLAAQEAFSALPGAAELGAAPNVNG